MRHLKELGLGIFLAALYFGVAYFTAAALAPTLAIHCAFAASAVAAFIYLYLAIVENEEVGPITGLFVVYLPIICVAVGIVWWIANLLGIWNLLSRLLDYLFGG